VSGVGAARSARVARTADLPRERYRAAVEALAAPLAHRLVARDRSQQDLLAGRRAVSDRLARSAARVRDADAAVSAARRAADRTDVQAGQLWRELALYCGRHQELGEVPPAGAVGHGTATAGTLLGRAERMLAAARRGELPLAPPISVGLAMLIAGAAGAAVLAGVSAALLSAAGQMHGTEHTVSVVLGVATRFLAPLGGLPIGLTWLSRYGRPLTGRSLGVLLGAGIVVGYGLAVLLW
jgi:hypothetical protein